ncbi:MAG: hypothetical protein Q9168_004992 [Polycauliona sp. 1 TL-2023]
MRSSTFTALALFSAVIALPTPQPTSNSAKTQGDRIAPPGPIDPSDAIEVGNGETYAPGVLTPISGKENSTTDQPGAATIEDLSSCGEAYYAPDKYTCYGDLLCPIVDGKATLKCGDACYLESLYTCAGKVLTSVSGKSTTSSNDSTTKKPTSTTDSSRPTSTENPKISFAMDGSTDADPNPDPSNSYTPLTSGSSDTKSSDSTNPSSGDDDTSSSSGTGSGSSDLGKRATPVEVHGCDRFQRLLHHC